MISAEQIKTKMSEKDKKDFADYEIIIDKMLDEQNGSCIVEYKDISIHVINKILHDYAAEGFDVKLGDNKMMSPPHFIFTMKTV